MSDDFGFGINVNVNDKDLQGAIKTLEKLKDQAGKGVESPFSGISKKELDELRKTTGDLLNPKSSLPDTLKETGAGIDDITQRFSKFGAVAASSFTMRGAMSIGVLRSMTAQFGGVGLTAGIVAHNVMQTASSIDSLTKKTHALGISAKDVYDLSHALTLSGAEDGEASATSLLSKIKEIQEEAKRGGGAFTGAIQEASIRGGSDISQVFMGEDPLESFRDLVKYFDDVPEVNKDDILKGFGFDTGAANVIRGGLAEFDKAMKESRDIGSTKEQFEAISKASADLEDALARLGRKFDSVTIEPMTVAIKSLAENADSIQKSTTQELLVKASKEIMNLPMKPISFMSDLAFYPLDDKEKDTSIPELAFLKVKDLIFGEEKKQEQKIQKVEKTYNIRVDAKTADGEEIARKIAAQIRAIQEIEEENPL